VDHFVARAELTAARYLNPTIVMRSNLELFREAARSGPENMNGICERRLSGRFVEDSSLSLELVFRLAHDSPLYGFAISCRKRIHSYTVAEIPIEQRAFEDGAKV
jgi:hypothetical protein